MSYLTTLQLAESPGPRELAEVATPQDQDIIGEALMDLTLRGGDRSSYDSGLVDVADLALERINTVIAETDELIDGYLARRYTLPLTSPSKLLTVQARSIVRYRLHKDLRDDDRSHPIVRDYRDALKMLEAIGRGDVLLGVEDPGSAAEAGAQVQFETGAKVFGRDRCGRSAW